MTTGSGILFRFVLLFGLLLVGAFFIGQFTLSAIFGFALILTLAAEALWLLGDRRRIHH